MTQQTDAATGYFDDVTEFVPAFEDGEYILTVVRIEPSDGGKFEPGLKWVFGMVSRVTGERVLAPNSNEPYELFQFSSKKLTPRTKIFPWITAFLGRQPAIGESGVELVRLVLGKSAMAYVGVAADDPGGRQRILTIKPVLTATAPRAVQAPAPPPEPAPVEEDDEEALLARLEAARAKKGAANREKAGVSEEAYRAIFENQIPV